MKRRNYNDEVMCIVCDLWWLWLLLFLLLLAALLLRDYWLPYLLPLAAPTPTMSIPSATAPPQPTVTSAAIPTMGTGDVQATLRWNNLNDLDLHVIDPDGNEIYFSRPSSPTGGLLDVDSNAGCSEPVTTRPVENIYWPVGAAPHGEYRVAVVFYRHCDPNSDSSAFSITLLMDGATQTFSGEVSESDSEVTVHRFTR
ncbi:MAG TPA: hypothetical protein VHP14_08975 [Anaerolineales bacterium]|nr:hypothetical protein [Anaerolineales bacterium]